MNEEEKQVIEELKEEINKPLEVPEDKFDTFILYNIENAKILLNIVNKQQKEIEELKKVIKMVEVYKAYGIPEDVEMVIMRKDDFLRNTNNEFISKDKIREKIKELEQIQNTALTETTIEIMDYKITILKQLLEE